MRGDLRTLAELLLKGGGVDEDVKKLVWFVVDRDSLVDTSEAARVLGVSCVTVRRRCERLGVRRIQRYGKQGALVDLRALVEDSGHGCPC